MFASRRAARLSVRASAPPALIVAAVVLLAIAPAALLALSPAIALLALITAGLFTGEGTIRRLRRALRARRVARPLTAPLRPAPRRLVSASDLLVATALASRPPPLS